MEYRIKEILKCQNISISDLADRLNIKRESLSRIVNGASTSVDTLQNIADTLNVHITELFSNDGIIGFIKANSTTYEINSIADIEKLLEEIRGKEIETNN